MRAPQNNRVRLRRFPPTGDVTTRYMCVVYTRKRNKKFNRCKPTFRVNCQLQKNFSARKNRAARCQLDLIFRKSTTYMQYACWFVRKKFRKLDRAFTKGEGLGRKQLLLTRATLLRNLPRRSSQLREPRTSQPLARSSSFAMNLPNALSELPLQYPA